MKLTIRLSTVEVQVVTENCRMCARWGRGLLTNLLLLVGRRGSILTQQ